MRFLAALPLLLVLTACGAETGTPGPAAAPTTDSSEPTGGLVTTTYAVTVLDDGDGAELCLGGVLESLPPQCGGPRLLGWAWAEHAGDFERAAGTRWGEFVVTGRFDGTDLTPTEVVPATEAPPGPEGPEGDQFTTACPEPAEGWPRVPGNERAFAAAARLDGYVDAWWDQDTHVVNVRVVGDTAAAEAAIRERWDGALCVTGGARTERELRRIQGEVLDSVPGLLGGGIDDQQVQVSVVHDDGSLQRRLDEEYGAGLVVVSSALHPVS